MAFIAKLTAIFVLFAITFLFGISPSAVLRYLGKSNGKVKYYLGILNSVAGGIFFGTAILHLLPNSIKQLEIYPEVGQSVVFVLVGVGFFLMLITEHVIGMYHSFHFHGNDGYENLDGKSHQTGDSRSKGSTLPDKCSDSIQMTSHEHSSDTYGSVFDDHEKTKQPECKSLGRECSTEKDQDRDCDRLSKIKTVILLIALSLHMVFEGLAIGLQQNDKEVWTLLGIISLHKCMVAFSIGLQLWTFRRMRTIILATVGFSVVAPIGIGIGTGISEYGSSGSVQGITSGVLQSLTTGTFLYITFFEILQKELSQKFDLVKVFSSLLGYVLVIGINLLGLDS